jgi:hypothetical protein
MNTATQDGITSSQPGTSVSAMTHYDENGHRAGVRLSVTRYYPYLPNEFGGIGVIKPLDCNGMIFKSNEEAFQFALERGYLQEYRRDAFRRIETKIRNRLWRESLKLPVTEKRTRKVAICMKRITFKDFCSL